MSEEGEAVAVYHTTKSELTLEVLKRRLELSPDSGLVPRNVLASLRCPEIATSCAQVS